jgi:chemotaxis protein MotB
MAKRGQAHGGGHGWFVTFADLMALLVSFFVMLVAFSNQDSVKMQIVAGSMREAFGTQKENRYQGIVEVDGVPTRPRLKNAEQIPPELSTDRPTPDDLENQLKRGLKEITDRNFALAAASLRQALQELPDIAEISKHIVVTETPEGLNIELVDQDGRSMFPEGAREPYERTRAIVAKLAEAIRKFPYRLTVTVHTAASRQPPRPGFSPFDLSADRANAIRRILQDEGVVASQFYMVAARADNQPLFPEDSYLAANRRISITLMREAPPTLRRAAVISFSLSPTGRGEEDTLLP